MPILSYHLSVFCHVACRNFINHFRQAGLSQNNLTGEDWVTLPEFFKHQGFTTYGHGKLYHPNKPPKNDEPQSWSQGRAYVPLTTTSCTAKHDGGVEGARFCPDGNSSIDQFSDRNTTTAAIETLEVVTEAFKKDGTPFFLALGLHYPHQNWHVPLNVSSMYPDASDMPAALHQTAPLNAPDVAFTAELDGKVDLSLNEDLRGFASSKPADVSGFVTYDCPSPHNNTVPIYMQQQLRLGYCATRLARYCISFYLPSLMFWCRLCCVADRHPFWDADGVA